MLRKCVKKRNEYVSVKRINLSERIGMGVWKRKYSPMEKKSGEGIRVDKIITTGYFLDKRGF